MDEFYLCWFFENDVHRTLISIQGSLDKMPHKDGHRGTTLVRQEALCACRRS